jgi:pilus assembly protein CpaE
MSPVMTPIPLLLVADSADTCERIASALLSAPAFYRIERITSVELAQDGPPHDVNLAIVDHSLTATAAPKVVHQLNSAGVAVVALVDARDIQLVQETVLAGSAGLVATPFEDGQLWDTVANALERGARPVAPVTPTPSRNGTGQSPNMVIALYSPKGGSGTSFLAANLAVALQERGGRGAVLVEIGEGSGSQAIMLNLRSERTLGDLLVRYEPGDTELINGVLAVHSSGLKVLMAPDTAGVRLPADFVEDVTESLRHMFDFVIVDVQTSARTNATPTFRKANAVLAVVVPELTSLHYGRQFVESMNSTLPEVQLNIVLNRANMPAGVPVEAIHRHLKMDMAAQIPDDPDAVTGSINRGVPLMIGNRRTSVAHALEKLAQGLAPSDTARAASSGSLTAAVTPLGKLWPKGLRFGK